MIKNIVFERSIINVGIPQGSCLGRCCFLYISMTYFMLLMLRLNYLLIISFQHSDLNCVNSIINKELSEVAKLLCSHRLFINYKVGKMFPEFFVILNFSTLFKTHVPIFIVIC